MQDRNHDRDLLLAWRDGDRAAGSALIRGHAALMQRFYANKVTSPELVEELAQRTFVACVQGAPRFRGDSNFRTWLFAIANNVLREYYREHRRDARLDFGAVSIAETGAGPSSLLAASEQQRRLLAALRRLPLDAQVLIELYYWEDLTAPELAEILGIPVGTVRGRIGKARQALRAELDAMDRTRERSPTTEAEIDDWARDVRRQMK